MDKNNEIIEVRQFFSESEYLDLTELVKVSKSVVIFKQNKNGKEQLFFIGVNNLVILNEDLKRIELKEVINKYEEILFENQKFEIEEDNSKNFQEVLMECFLENQ